MNKDLETIPQCLSQENFASLATATPLVNHGRKWEVFLGERSLGFADDNSMAKALNYAHRREVNNALWIHENEGCGLAVPALPSVEAMKSYPEFIKMYPNSSAKVLGSVELR